MIADHLHYVELTGGMRGKFVSFEMRLDTDLSSCTIWRYVDGARDPYPEGSPRPEGLVLMIYNFMAIIIYISLLFP